MATALKKEIFFSEDSPQGQAKRDLISSSKMVAAQFPDATPNFRISWERLSELARTEKEKHVADLAACERGNELAPVYQNIPTASAVEILVNQMPEFLAEYVPGYNPKNGFDVDFLLKVVHPDFRHGVEALVDFFPRMESNKPVTEFATALGFRVPMVYLDDVAPDHFDIAVTVFIIDGRVKHKDFEGGRRLFQEWIALQGVWPILTEKATEYFISRMSNNVVEYLTGGGNTIVVPSVTREISSDRYMKGDLRFITTAQAR